jgi:hypothetical protein
MIAYSILPQLSPKPKRGVYPLAVAPTTAPLRPTVPRRYLNYQNRNLIVSGYRKERCAPTLLEQYRANLFS